MEKKRLLNGAWRVARGRVTHYGPLPESSGANPLRFRWPNLRRSIAIVCMAFAFFLSAQPLISIVDQGHHAKGEHHLANPLAGAIVHHDADHDDASGDTSDLALGHEHADGAFIAFMDAATPVLVIGLGFQKVGSQDISAFTMLAREGPERPPKLSL